MSSTRYSTKQNHIELSETLKQVRKETHGRFTQQELANRLGLSRETVVAIENCHFHTMQTLELATVEKWWKVCRQRGITQRTKERFIGLITRILHI